MARQELKSNAQTKKRISIKDAAILLGAAQQYGDHQGSSEYPTTVGSDHYATATLKDLKKKGITNQALFKLHDAGYIKVGDLSDSSWEPKSAVPLASRITVNPWVSCAFNSCRPKWSAMGAI